MTQRTRSRSLRPRGMLLAAAALLLIGGRAEAQWGMGWGWPGGWGGWGYGGWGGWPSGWGGGVGYGMSLPQLQFYRMQRAGLNASRYNLNNAEAASAYQSANLYHQAAVGSMLNNYQRAYGMAREVQEERAAQRERAAQSGPGGTGAGGRPSRAPSERPATFREMIADDGEVFWPLGAPNNGELGSKREAAGRAIQQAMQDAKTRGEPSVRKVIAAREALADYAVPAARQLREDKPDDAKGFETFINTLDGGLRSLVAGNAPAGGAGGRANIEPPSAPETAGDVLKKEVEQSPKTRKP